MIIDGVRETPPYAHLYGAANLPLAAQRDVVKRHKDRLKKKAQRLGIRIRHEQR